MELITASRKPNAFQVSLTPNDIDRIVHRNMGSSLVVREAREIGIGMYNSTYRLEFESAHPPVFLRVAPEPDKQFRSERHLMRNEYATAPWLSHLSVATPTILTADWTHSLIPRDYLLQSQVPGVPAPEKLSSYPKPLWSSYFRHLGQLTREVHTAAQSTAFGRVAGPEHLTLLEWLHASLDDIVTDLQDCGVDAEDVRLARTELARLRNHFDDMTTSALLTGDMWTANVLLASDADTPTVIGAVDFDRSEWGDPLADWPIRMARRRSPEDEAAFWDGYGTRLDLMPGARCRLLIYEIRHLAAVRLENIRLGDIDGVRGTYERIRSVLDQLADEV